MLCAIVRDQTQLRGITQQNHVHLCVHENGIYNTLSDITVPPKTKMLFYETKELINKGYKIIYPTVLYEGFYPNCEVVLQQFIPTAVNIENQLPMYNCIRLSCEKINDVLIKHVMGSTREPAVVGTMPTPPPQHLTSASSALMF